MTVRSSNGSYEFIDFRETAPAAAFESMYTNDTDLSIYGGLARLVPQLRAYNAKREVDFATTAVSLASCVAWNTCTITTASFRGRISSCLP